MSVKENQLDQSITTKLKVLISDDDAPTRILLRAAISQWNYDVVETKNGEEAWDILQQENAPRLLILDWLMPKLDGIELCTRIKRVLADKPYIYIILLTQQSGTTNIIKGLEAGADEFLSKPFNMAALRSRLSVGARIVMYETELSEKNKELQNYLDRIEQLAEISSKLSKAIFDIRKYSSTLDKSLDNASMIQHITDVDNGVMDIKNIIELLKAVHKGRNT